MIEEKNESFISLRGRLSFPDIFEAKPFKPGDEPRFRATFLIDKGSEEAKRVEVAIKKVAVAKWGVKADSILTSIRNNPNKFCFQDGDMKSYDGYAGMMALSSNSQSRPLIIDKDRTPLTVADGRPYGGCYVVGLVEFFAYTNSGNGISASLKGVQFWKDGDRFTGGAPAEVEDFQDLSDTGEDDAGSNYA